MENKEEFKPEDYITINYFWKHILITFSILLLVAEFKPEELNDGINAARVKYLSFLKLNRTFIIIIASFCILLAIILIILLLRYIKQINKVIPIVKRCFQIAL